MAAEESVRSSESLKARHVGGSAALSDAELEKANPRVNGAGAPGERAEQKNPSSRCVLFCGGSADEPDRSLFISLPL